MIECVGADTHYDGGILCHFDPSIPDWCVVHRSFAKKTLIYIAGSMKNRDGIRKVTQQMQDAGFNTFNDWIMPGEETDQKWQEFEQAQGRTYLEALQAPHAKDVFYFDKEWLDKSDAIILVLPAGKSAHIELGYMVGRGKPAFILLEGEPERWDVMYLFATLVTDGLGDIIGWLQKHL